MDLLTAELYRKKGYYSESLRILGLIQDSLGDARFIADQIRKHAEEKDPRVFEIVFQR